MRRVDAYRELLIIAADELIRGNEDYNNHTPTPAIDALRAAVTAPTRDLAGLVGKVREMLTNRKQPPGFEMPRGRRT